MRFLLACSLLLSAEEFTVQPLQEGAPSEVSEGIRKDLAAAGTRVVRNGYEAPTPLTVVYEPAYPAVDIDWESVVS